MHRLLRPCLRAAVRGTRHAPATVRPTPAPLRRTERPAGAQRGETLPHAPQLRLYLSVFKTKAVANVRLLYRKCTEALLDWGEHLSGDPASSQLLQKGLSQLESEASWNEPYKHETSPKQFAAAAAFLRATGVANNLLGVYVKSSETELHYLLAVSKTELTLPVKAYVQEGVLNETFLGEYREF